MGDRMPAAARDHLPRARVRSHPICDLGIVSGGRGDLDTAGTWVDQTEERGRRGPPGVREGRAPLRVRKLGFKRERARA